MGLEMRTKKMRVGINHPDFLVAEHQAFESRRQSNTLNFIARAIFDQRAKNYEHNRNCTDPSQLIENPHTFLEPLYSDERLIGIPGVIEWIKKHPTCNFEHKYNI